MDDNRNTEKGAVREIKGAMKEGVGKATDNHSQQLKGNIESAKRVELQEGGVITGDVKAGSLTVAAGSRMRGQVEFGWEEDSKAAPRETKGFGTAT